jgi:hypothetical protein
MIHHPAQTPPPVAAGYPAHLHMNLLPRLQHRHGSKLLTPGSMSLGRGARAFHVGVNRENTGAIHFWRTRAFEALVLDSLPEGRTLWMGRNA